MPQNRVSDTITHVILNTINNVVLTKSFKISPESQHVRLRIRCRGDCCFFTWKNPMMMKNYLQLTLVGAFGRLAGAPLPHDRFLLPSVQGIWGKISRDPNVTKSNWLHVDIFWLFFDNLMLYIPLK